MPKLNSTIPVAHLNIRGASVLVAFPDPDQAKHYAALQTAATRAGFAGELAIVWEDPQGRTRFIAPPQQHPFFQVATYSQLRAQVNGAIQV
ncbi:MAG: hypothetical protein ACRD4E_12880 [Bryobacteraceae bacterium]